MKPASALRQVPDTRPNLFVVGAPKAGTTSVDQLLRTDPRIFLSPIKEPSHFCTDVAQQLAPTLRKKNQIDVGAYLDAAQRPPVGLAWVGDPGHYARLFDAAQGHALVGECSTFYLSSQVAAARIARYNPDARIVALVRDPLQRIRSHYQMDRAHGAVPGPLLASIRRERALGSQAHWGNCPYYLGASRYRQQLRRYYDHFPRESICVLSFERMLADPQSELGTLYQFLGLDPPGALALPSANRAKSARFGAFNRALYASGLKPMVSATLKRVLPSGFRQTLQQAYYTRGRGAVDERELEALDAILEEEGLEREHLDALRQYAPTPALLRPALHARKMESPA
jgi:hypothetical protein